MFRLLIDGYGAENVAETTGLSKYVETDSADSYLTLFVNYAEDDVRAGEFNIRQIVRREIFLSIDLKIIKASDLGGANDDHVNFIPKRSKTIILVSGSKSDIEKTKESLPCIDQWPSKEFDPFEASSKRKEDDLSDEKMTIKWILGLHETCDENGNSVPLLETKEGKSLRRMLEDRLKHFYDVDVPYGSSIHSDEVSKKIERFAKFIYEQYRGGHLSESLIRSWISCGIDISAEHGLTVPQRIKRDVEYISDQNAEIVAKILGIDGELPFTHKYKTIKERVLAFLYDKLPLGVSYKKITEAHEFLEKNNYKL